MTQPTKRNPDPGALAQVARTFQLVWRLLTDPRVPFLTKLIIPGIILYVLSPLDLIPDPILVLGQLDDIGVIFFGLRFFIELCPPEVVLEHRRALGQTSDADEYVDATYRVVNDKQKK